MLVDVISMIASVGSSIIGSGTLSTLTSRFPCQVTAFMCIASSSAQTRCQASASSRTAAEYRRARSEQSQTSSWYPAEHPPNALRLFTLDTHQNSKGAPTIWANKNRLDDRRPGHVTERVQTAGVSPWCSRGTNQTVTSLWLSDRAEQPWAASKLDDSSRSAEVIVVGAGITGLMTAVLLARAGKDVLVLEARTVGACATGNTTAKISLLQGSHLSKILSKHGKNVARAYVEGNRKGQRWVLNHCESRGVALQREDAYTYAQSSKGVASARAELKACQAAGLPAAWEDDAEVPFPFHGGVRLAEQAQFDPMCF